ncbi:MAG: fatty acid desaturase family protein [Streptosporangiales bacterium]
MSTALPPVRTGGPVHVPSDYAALSRQVKDAGLMGRRPGYYTAKIAINGLLFTAGWAVFFVLGNSWWQLLVAAYIAVMFTQIAFIGHDAGHKQIFRTRRASYVLGLLHGNLAVGLSYGWWVDKHNRHHANPNHEEKDPDIGGNALAYTPGQADARRGLGRLLGRAQAYLFFPMLLLEGMHLHVASIRALVGRTKPHRRRWLEAGVLAAHLGAYLAALFLVLSPGLAVAFIAVHQGLFGLYMGLSFAPNHKGMPVFGPDDDVDYLRRQVLTSRNVRGNRFTDLLLGGLNYQIEHHLFSSMPRPNLRHARLVVRRFCAERGVSYAETSLADSYAQVIKHLYAVGAPLRGPIGE